MKRVLFVIPDLGIGGTNPSLEALYDSIKDLYHVTVFAISHHTRYRSFLFDDVLMPQSAALSFLYTDFERQRGIKRIIAFVIKSINRLLSLLGTDLKVSICKSQAQRLEARYSFDDVVAYQEGYATEFVSYFKNPHKVAWVHCNYDKWMPKEKSEESLYRQFTHIVCVSNYTASVFAARYPVLKSRTVGIHNFIDSGRILRLGSEIVDDPRFLSSGFTILSAGRIHEVKRFREIPAIAAQIKKRGLDFRWYIIGDTSDLKEISLFRDNAIKNCVSDYVIWLGGKSNPYPYFKAADLYVCTSESEACPMVFIEATLLGTPIVTTDFPSAFEFIEDKVNGCIVPLEIMADSICEMIENTSCYSVILDNIKETVIDNSRQLDEVMSIL